MQPWLPIAALLASPALAAEPASLTGTRLDVSASASISRTPDLATISTGVVTQARSAGLAMSDNAARMTQVIAALRKAGIPDRAIQTSALSLGLQYRYADNQPPVLTGYQATNRVSVRVRELDRVGAVLDALVAAGANQIDGPELTVEHPEPALDEARTQALATARTRAELYARAAGLHVKRIVSIGEGATSEPVLRPMRMMAASAPKASTPFQSGEQTMTVDLHVTFELN